MLSFEEMPHALIIGGTKGTGKVIAQMFLNKGFKVSVLGRTNPDPENKNIQYELIDLIECDEIILLNCLNRIKNNGIDSVVFCQRYRGEGDCWENELKLSLTATKKIIECLVEHQMLNPKGASVVSLGSIAGTRAVYQQPVSYHVVKAGIQALMTYYAITYASLRIRFNTIIPGTIVKPESAEFYRQNEKLSGLYQTSIPLGAMINSQDIADLVDFLCSDKAKMITGQEIYLDGGINKIAPESLLLKKFNF